MINKNKKAQAAMEFLMTYGWAILVVIVVIAALTYFGVLSPQNLLPSRCETGEIWLKCVDYKIDATNNVVILTLENNGQSDVNISGFNLTSTSLNFACGNSSGAALGSALIQGAQIKIGTAACSPKLDINRAGRGKIKADLSVLWYRKDIASALTHPTTGTIVANIEK